ncbi:MAG: type II glyceraldehyde-3-phosphate dehydrogenase [Candidatus Nanohaloarchaea archaeon]|nr:type II glyceraldehyde-3-phosphate dehydrogenase [Candidatus Nanohaloarchaea archaeon]
MAKIAVNGVGTIGKRLAEAVIKQDDMELAGVADAASTPDLKVFMQKNPEVPLYACGEEAEEEIGREVFSPEGQVEELVEEADLVFDATPSGIDKKNKEELYRPMDTKAIFQGGADGDIAPVKFNASANFEEALGEDFVKVVSCNTTSLCRTLKVVDDELGIDSVTASLVRRGGDPKQDSRGPINSIIPVTEVPSHHGPDVQEVMPEIDVQTLAVKAPTTLSHVHMVEARLDKGAEREEIRRLFKRAPRIRLEKAGHGFDSTAKVMEKMRDLNRPRSDMPEATVWEETITAEGKKLYWIHMVHQESIVVPDNIDAVRSMLEMADKEESIRKTDRNLGLK